MRLQRRGALTRRRVLAALPVGIVSGATAPRAVAAQPSAADPVSFYLGQVLALATLQSEAIRRLRPFLAAPNAEDAAWQAGTAAEAGVIGAVASVLVVMEPPAELTASVSELRLASNAYQGAADAARGAANGDEAALAAADAGLAEGATHILLWLDALTAETGNDWGDGQRTLTGGVTPVPVAEIEEPPPAEPPEAEAAEDAGDSAPTEETAADGQGRNRQNRRDRQAQQEEQPEPEAGDQSNRQNRQNRQNRAAE